MSVDHYIQSRRFGSVTTSGSLLVSHCMSVAMDIRYESVAVSQSLCIGCCKLVTAGRLLSELAAFCWALWIGRVICSLQIC